MDAFHERLARIALARIAAYGFCLAGGYAVQAHGILDRPSEDVDLFTTSDAEALFPAAVAEVIQAYVDVGLVVSTLVDSPGFARLEVSAPSVDVTSKVELGIDWRAHPPTVLAIGPVLHPDDAVANKVGALYSRAQTRDYIDVDAALRSGRYSGEALLRLAGEHDPGFDVAMFADALRAVRRLPLAEFTAYGLNEAEVAALRADDPVGRFDRSTVTVAVQLGEGRLRPSADFGRSSPIPTMSRPGMSRALNGLRRIRSCVVGNQHIRRSFPLPISRGCNSRGDRTRPCARWWPRRAVRRRSAASETAKKRL